GAFRTFFDLHVAKSRKAARAAGRSLPHLFTTSYVTQRPLEARLRREREARGADSGLADVELLLSPGRSVGLRLVPTVRDLKLAREERRHQRLDVQQQRVLESLHAALIDWAKGAGEASDYVDNLPSQCLHPVGHWYELPNLLRNGVLRDLIARRPELKTLLLHNIDTLGAGVDPGLLGLHLSEVERGAALTFEVIARQLDDRGGRPAPVPG